MSESYCDYLNWIMHLKANACLHCHCIDNWPARHRINGNHSCTLLYHWGGLNVTTLPWCLVILRCVLSLKRPLPYGRTDKNRQTIAATLRLRFAARVNNYYNCSSDLLIWPMLLLFSYLCTVVSWASTDPRVLKFPCSTFQGVSVAALYAIYIPKKRPYICVPKSQVSFKRPWVLTQDILQY